MPAFGRSVVRLFALLRRVSERQLRRTGRPGLIGGSRRATEVWVHVNFPLRKQPLRYVDAVSGALTPAAKLS